MRYAQIQKRDCEVISSAGIERPGESEPALTCIASESAGQEDAQRARIVLPEGTDVQAIQIIEAKADRGADQVNRDEWLAVLQGDACSGKGGSGASGRERIGGAKNKSNGGSGRCSRFSMVDEQQVRRACFRFDGVTDCVCVTHVL